MLKNSISSKLFLFSFIIFIISMIFALFLYLFVKETIVNYEYQNIKKEIQIFLELRSYLASLPKEKFDDTFSCSPAFVVSKLSERLKVHNYIIRQVSPNYRNINDKPNSVEKEVFNYFNRNKDKKEFFEIKEIDNQKMLFYAVPLRIDKSCLKCHGDPKKDVPKKIYNLLLNKYGYSAFNYKIGDLRGIIDIQKPYFIIEQKVNNLFLIIFMGSSIIFFIAMYLFRRLNKQIEADIEKFNRYYKEYLSKKRFVKFNEKLNFSDFNKIIISMNEFVNSIKNSKRLIYSKIYFDSITKLPNRNKLFQISNRKYSVMVVDIESFRDFNTVFGYSKTDEILKEVAKKIRSLKLVAYHIGIDKFAIIFYKKEDRYKYKYILNTLEGYYTIENQEILVKFRAGVYRDIDVHPLKEAEFALDIAKKRNESIVFYEDVKELEKEYEHNIFYIQEIKEAIDNNRVIPFYQPIVDREGNIVKYEALMRIEDSNNNILLPDKFLLVAKKTRYYKELTKIIIFKSLLLFENLKEGVSLNLTAEDLNDEIMRDFIIESVRNFKDKESITFEIVESEMIEDLDFISEFLLELKKYGCKIYIDDFGTGYSNFEYLLKLYPDGVKIDGSLVKDILINPDSEAIIKNIINFAKYKNLEVVVEYVSNKEIYEKLKSLGVDYFQGFYFSKPIRGDEIENSISNRK